MACGPAWCCCPGNPVPPTTVSPLLLLLLPDDDAADDDDPDELEGEWLLRGGGQPMAAALRAEMVDGLQPRCMGVAPSSMFTRWLAASTAVGTGSGGAGASAGGGAGAVVVGCPGSGMNRLLWPPLPRPRPRPGMELGLAPLLPFLAFFAGVCFLPFFL